MKCQNAGRPCERLATLIVEIPGVGRRRFCAVCWSRLTAIAMPGRVTEPPPPRPLGAA